MGSIRKQSILSFLFSYLGVVLGYVNWGLILPTIMPPVYYGLIKFVRDTSFFFAKISQLGGITGLVKYFPKYSNSKEEQDKFYSFILQFFLFGYSIVILILTIFSDTIINFYKDKAPLLEDYFYFLIPFTFVLSISMLFFVLFNLNKKSSIATFFQDIGNRILVFLLIIVHYFVNFELNTFINLFLIIHVLILFIQAFYFKKMFNVNFSIEKNIKKYRTDKFFEYTTYNLLGSLLGLVVKYIDTLMITFYLGFSQNGIYGFSFLIASLVEYPRSSLINSITNDLTTKVHNNEFEEVSKLNKRVTQSLLVIGSFLFLIITINIKLYSNLIKPEFLSGFRVVYWIGASRLVRLLSGASSQILDNSSEFKKNLPIGVGTFIIVIITNILFIERYGIEGAAMGSFIAILFTNSAIVYIVKKKFKISPFTKESLLSPVLLFVLLIIFNQTDISLHTNYNQTTNTILNMAYKTVVASILFWGIAYPLKLSKDINNLINLSIEKVKTRFK